MSVLAIFCFLLPVESGEKVSLGITVLLSQAVELLVVSDILPPTSGNFPIIASFIIFTIVLIFISVTNSVLVSRVYHTNASNNCPTFLVPMLNSRIMAKLFLNTLEEVYGKTILIQVENRATNTFNFSGDKKTSKVAACPEKKNAATQTTDFAPIQEFNSACWKLLSALLDRVVLILYLLTLMIGTVYYIIAFNSSDN